MTPPYEITKVTEDAIDYAGQVNVRNVTILTVNGKIRTITPQVQSISLYESIDAMFLSGNIVINDVFDFSSLFPLTGHEIVTLEISTPGLDGFRDVSRNFYIYKMSNREMSGDKKATYKLHFISVEGVIGLNKKISQGFSGNIGELAREMFTSINIGMESAKDIFIEPVVKNTRYVSNFWTPIENVKYLASLAVNRNGAPYVCFENRDGFSFTSMEDMYNQEIYKTLLLDNYSRDMNQAGRAFNNPEEESRRISALKIKEGYNYIDSLETGVFGSRQVGYDIRNHRYFIRDYDSGLDAKRVTQNQFNVFPAKKLFAYEAAQMTYLKNNGIFLDYDDTTNQETIQKRKSLLNLANANTIYVSIPGRLDYTVGTRVFVLLPKTAPMREMEEDIYDERFSGSYIFSSIHHHITSGKHEIHAELISDTMSVNPDN